MTDPRALAPVPEPDLIVAFVLRHPVRPPVEQLVTRHALAEIVAWRGDVAVQTHVHAEDQFPHAVPTIRACQVVAVAPRSVRWRA